MRSPEVYAHETAQVDSSAEIGRGTKIWNLSTVRERAKIGEECTIGQSVYIDRDVSIGSRCKIQNGVSVFSGVTLGDRVFVGPGATFTNDRVPRAVGDWEIVPTVVDDDASIGANATIVCGVRLGKACMVGAGSVVISNVAPHELVVGNPARFVDYVDMRGKRLGWEGPGVPPAERLEQR